VESGLTVFFYDLATRLYLIDFHLDFYLPLLGLLILDFVHRRIAEGVNMSQAENAARVQKAKVTEGVFLVCSLYFLTPYSGMSS